MEELLFKYLPIELDIDQPFGLLKRGSDTVVALVRNGQGQWMLGHKSYIYPQGIARMVGGAADDQNPLVAIQREIEEELQVSIDEERFQPLVHAEIIGHLPDGKEISTSVFVFYVTISEQVKASDDITGIAYLSDRDMLALISRFEQLPAETIIREDEPDSTWQMYGRIWGPIHAAAMERVKELGL